jgi:hypothetical protein
MPPSVIVTRKQGSIMGTVIAAVRDDLGEVAAVDFYVTVLDTRPGQTPSRLGPYPADILRRPAPGVYEKDVLLDPQYDTKVETELQLVNATSRVIGEVQTFATRTAPTGGGATLLVQDQDSAAAEATKLVFQGSVVSVANGVATFTLDGRYSLQNHTHEYLPLAGGSIAGALSFGSAVRQMLNLWGTAYAIGVQSSTQYFRTGGGYAWYLGGTHSDTQWNPGSGTTLMTLTNGGALAVSGVVSAGSVKATGNRFLGPDDAYMHLSNTAAQFLTGGAAALQGRFGSLLLSDTYADAAGVPARGLYAKGGARLGPSIDIGVGAYSAGIRRPDGGHLHLQAGVAGSVVIGEPASVTHKVNVQGDVNLQGGAYRVNGTSWYGDNALLFGWGGGWRMQNGTWMETQNQKSVWTGTGNLGTDGGLTLGRGAVLDPGLRIDSQGRIRACSQAQAAGFGAAALELREYNFSGNSGDNGWHNAPRISFHWGGVRAMQMGMSHDGRIHILDDTGTSNGDLQARSFYNDHNHVMAASLSGQGNPGMAASVGSLYIQY